MFLKRYPCPQLDRIIVSSGNDDGKAKENVT